MYFRCHRRYLEAIGFYVVCRQFYRTTDRSICRWQSLHIQCVESENLFLKEFRGRWRFFFIFFMKQTEWAFKRGSLSLPLGRRGVHTGKRFCSWSFSLLAPWPPEDALWHLKWSPGVLFNPQDNWPQKGRWAGVKCGFYYPYWTAEHESQEDLFLIYQSVSLMHKSLLASDSLVNESRAEGLRVSYSGFFLCK